MRGPLVGAHASHVECWKIRIVLSGLFVRKSAFSSIVAIRGSTDDDWPRLGWASAGGLAAFRTFFDNMPADTGMAFVLVQHLDPNQSSMLAELLQSHTQMPVEEARDRRAIAANQVFVIPPNATLTLEGNVLRVCAPRAPARESPAH